MRIRPVLLLAILASPALVHAEMARIWVDGWANGNNVYVLTKDARLNAAKPQLPATVSGWRQWNTAYNIVNVGATDADDLWVMKKDLKVELCDKSKIIALVPGGRASGGKSGFASGDHCPQ